MAIDSSCFVPMDQICRTKTGDTGDLVILDAVADWIDSEPLCGTGISEQIDPWLDPLIDALMPRIRACVASLVVEFAIVCGVRGGQFIGLRLVYHKRSRKETEGLARKLLKHAGIERVLRWALDNPERAGSENFPLAVLEGRVQEQVMIQGCSIRDLCAVSLDRPQCLVVFVNRRLSSTLDTRRADKADARDAEVPWYRYDLYFLRRLLTLSPLQISHAVLERELPGLLLTHPGQWVVYHGAERLGIFETEEEAEQIAIERGIPEKHTYLQFIEEEASPYFGCRS